MARARTLAAMPAVIVGLAGVYACAAVVGIEETQTVAADASGADGASSDDVSVPPPPDAGVDACNASAAEIWEPQFVGVSSRVCDLESARYIDEKYAGLDITGAGIQEAGGGQSITSCIAVDFRGLALASARVRAQAVASGCTATPCSGTNCTEPLSARVFVATSRDAGSWVFGEAIRFDASGVPGEAEVTMPEGGVYSHVIVCRNAVGVLNNDIALDGVEPRCR